MLESRDIRTVWDDILPGIKKIHESLPWREWRIEDIYSECASGAAAVFTKQGEEDPGKSFFVAKINVNESTGQRVLFLWIAWSPEEMGAEAIREDLEALALSQGCTAIEFITAEEKLVEYAKGFGFDKVMYQAYRSLI